MKTLIIDDEINCCKTLQMLLEKTNSDISVLPFCRNGLEGLDAIRNGSPELVFLDVEMPRMNGFEMLEQLHDINFHLIFTTSYDQYALKAFRFSAVDYLLKPIDKEELAVALDKVRRSQKALPQQIESLLQKMQHPLAINKIALPTMEGLQMLPVDSIISGEADDNYTILHLKTGKKLVVSRTLKDIEALLEDHSFYRVHRCYLVNLNEIEKYVRGEGGYLIMSNGTTIDVSRSNKDALLRRLLPR